MQNTARPVTIISGFLRAGKTSFLNEYLALNKIIRPIIIENEFGKEGIDAGLILARRRMYLNSIAVASAVI